MLACTQKLQAQKRKRQTEPAAATGAEVGPTLSLNKLNLNTASHVRIYHRHNGIIARAPYCDCVACHVSGYCLPSQLFVIFVWYREHQHQFYVYLVLILAAAWAKTHSHGRWMYSYYVIMNSSSTSPQRGTTLIRLPVFHMLTGAAFVTHHGYMYSDGPISCISS